MIDNDWVDSDVKISSFEQEGSKSEHLTLSQNLQNELIQNFFDSTKANIGGHHYG